MYSTYIQVMSGIFYAYPAQLAAAVEYAAAEKTNPTSVLYMTLNCLIASSCSEA